MTPDDLTPEMFWAILALVAIVYLAVEGWLWLGKRFARAGRVIEGARQILEGEPATWDGDER